MLQATGGTHVTSVVSGDAWGVIGGPESNALANTGNSDPIISVSNVVNRANVYLMAKKGTAPPGSSDEELKAFLQDKNQRRTAWRNAEPSDPVFAAGAGA